VEERYESELTRSATVLDGVDQALERLSNGSYGTRESGGTAISGADLERDPTRRYCEQHLELLESGFNESGFNESGPDDAASNEADFNEADFNEAGFN
jgi:RNA polymerase-binding transcription factor DksA